MALSMMHITFDCENASELASFWSAALDRPIDPGQPQPSEHFASIGRTDSATGVPAMLFLKVPEGKSAKNRVHLDLDTDDREGEVARLIELGATIVAEKDEWGTRWTTLADPEGNEFCVASH